MARFIPRADASFKRLLAVLLLFVLLFPGKTDVLAAPKTVGSYGMLPVYGRDVADGTYPVAVESNSSFFKIREASLLAEDGELTLTFTISSLSYLYVYPGTGMEAEDAPETEWIPRVEREKKSLFTVRVEALDSPFDCAAFSKNRKRWYDRKLLVRADSLPKEALRVELPDYEQIADAVEYYKEAGLWEEREVPQGTAQDIADGIGTAADGTGTPSEGAAAGAGESVPEPEAAEIALKDGEYSIEAVLAGGSGRAQISSPTLLIVRDGRAYVRLLWSSPYYDYMILQGKTYYNLTEDGGNSVFEIPLVVLDEGIPVIADTTAMGDPVEIEYEMTFYLESVGDRGLIPQEAAKKVLVIALVIILAGGVLNWLVKRKRKG